MHHMLVDWYNCWFWSFHGICCQLSQYSHWHHQTCLGTVQFHVKTSKWSFTHSIMCAHVHVFQSLARWFLLPVPCGTESWVHHFSWNKHLRTNTHTHTLSSALSWQAEIPTLAYESQQLEGVAVTVVAVACCLLCYPFGWQVLCSR